MTIQSEGSFKSLRPLSRLILIFLGIPLVFAIGFAFATIRAQSERQELASRAAEAAAARRQLARTQLQHNLARLQGTLGLVMYEANRNNFANATSYAAQFFDGLRAALSNRDLPTVADGAQLESILAMRDEISSALARADPAVKQKLADLYVQFDRDIGGSTSAHRAGST
ncbi:MAG: hypothetical protein M3041_11945 [Acidobacteriota bacterium]|nr:hypothetical protein [Acidobacteriota bacterium]